MDRSRWKGGYEWMEANVKGMERWIEMNRSGWKRREGMEGWIEVDGSVDGRVDRSELGSG